MAISSLVVLSLILIIQCSALHTNNNRTYIISEDLYTYIFSCASGQLVALSADKKSLLYYDVEQQSLTTSIDLPLPGELLQLSADGRYVAVTHDSYISLVSNHHALKTYPITVVEASSIVIIKELACLIPAFDQWTNIMCLNMRNGSTSTCDYSIYAGNLAFTNTAKGWVYSVDQGLSPQSMHKFNVSSKSQCLEYIHDNSDFGTYEFGEHLWFSCDGNRIFLQSGLTLFSSDDKLDMKPHGDFNSSYESYQYSYFSQSPTSGIIAGIRSDVNDTIYYYTSPYLQPMGSEKIPAPPQGAFNGAEEVHVCGKSDTTDATYIIVKYIFPGEVTKIGVVTSSRSSIKMSPM